MSSSKLCARNDPRYVCLQRANVATSLRLQCTNNALKPSLSVFTTIADSTKVEVERKRH